ncbi:MAG: thiamine pyrophosphate-dependent dehydrogenase E1 component subunit alpha [Alphaproteobacteria bacterium]|nr:thiamine pyrophosphate-dependent dehydrogenase E1 component subunit alpha [Alphaproteobacteria bacterium]
MDDHASVASEIEPAQLLRLHRQMLFLRMVEEAIAVRYAEQEMRCPVHLSVGQEAAAVGVCEALLKTDHAFTTHRCHAHYLMKGGDLVRMLAEIFGKADGCVGGRGGSMHLMDRDCGLEASVPIVGASIPLAVGAALADRLDKKDHISVAFLGDAALEEGAFYEAANFASLRKLPVLFACENNLYSCYTHLDQRQPSRNLTALPKAHGIRAWEVDGNDVGAVHEAAHEAVTHVRSGQGPAFLLMHTYRWLEHCGPDNDDHLQYRPEEEYGLWRERCPLVVSAASLRERGVLDDAVEDAMRAEFVTRIDEAFAAAKQAPLPEPAAAAGHVYA